MNLSILLDQYRSKWKLSDANEDTYGEPKTTLNGNYDSASTTDEMEKLEQSSATTTLIDTAQPLTIEDTEVTADYTITQGNTRQNGETTQTPTDNEIYDTTVTKAKYNEMLASDEDPKTKNYDSQVMEHNTAKYDKTVATESIPNNKDNLTTIEMVAETSEEGTTHNHIQAIEIIDDKTPFIEMTEDKDMMFISTLEDDKAVIETTGIFNQEDIVETFYKDEMESKEMDALSQSLKNVELDPSPIFKTPVPSSLIINNSSSPTSVLSNSHHMQVIVLLPAGFLVLIVLAFVLCAFLLKTRKRKLKSEKIEKIDLLSTVLYKDYKQVAKNNQINL